MRDSKAEDEDQGIMYRIGICVATALLAVLAFAGTIYLANAYSPGLGVAGTILGFFALAYLMRLAWICVPFIVHWN